MELTFNKEGNVYVAEFEVTKEFNLHLEKGDGIVKLYQRTVNGNYAWVEDFSSDNKFQRVFDYDSGPIYVVPKWLKIVSDVEPTYAAITTEGEVVEIKAQEKSVEITSNGTTSVEPDAGFSYLSKVDVNVNVPTEEGGGEDSEGGSGGGGNIEYIDLTNASGAAAGIVLMCSYFMKAVITSDTEGEIKVSGMPAPIIQEMGASFGGKTSFIACAVDLTHRIKISMGGQVQDVTVIEYGVGYGVKPEDFEALPRLTEEEFYNLES